MTLPFVSLLPAVSPSEMFEMMTDDLMDTFKTTVVRVQRLPEDLAMEIDQIVHIAVDLKGRARQSLQLITKLLAHDLPDGRRIGDPPAGRYANIVLAETYFWTAFCMVGFELALIVGSWRLLHIPAEPIFNKGNCLVCALVVLPFYIMAWLRKTRRSDNAKRDVIFLASVLMGLMISYANGRQSNIVFSPPLFMPPLCIGWCSCLTEYYPTVIGNRPVYLTLSIVSSIVAMTLYGYIFGSMDGSYRLWTFFLCAAILVELQLKLGRFRRRWSAEPLETWATCVTLMISQFVMKDLLGSTFTGIRKHGRHYHCDQLDSTECLAE